MPTDREQLEQVKLLIKAGEIEEARDILTYLAERSNTALRWLEELNNRYPPPDKLFESDSHDKRLLKAQDLLQQGAYQEARWVLIEIQHIPQARQWLIELDGIQAREKLKRKAEALEAQYNPNSPAQQLGDFVRSNAFSAGVGTLLMFIGLIVLVMWVLVPWIEGSSLLTDTQEDSCSAAELFAGREACQAMGFIDIDMLFRGNTGFVSVRWIDRLVVVIPAAAIGLVVIGWSYASRRTDPFTAYFVFGIAAATLAGFPYFWEHYSGEAASESELAQYISVGSFNLLKEFIETSYSVGEFKTIGIIAATLVASAGMLVLLEGMGVLGIPSKTDRLLNPDMVDKGASEFGGTIFERRRQQRPRK